MTLKQEMFVKWYLKTGNATEAAFNVYRTKKRTVASQIGYENLRKPEIRERIEVYSKLDSLSPTFMIETLSRLVNEGTARQKLKALELCFKLKGLI